MMRNLTICHSLVFCKGILMDILLPLLLVVFFALCAAYLRGMDNL